VGNTRFMPLLSKLARFAASPQGKRLARKAMAYAQSPEGKARIEQARRQIAQRRSRAKPR
jgi:hypothetical protein